MPARVTELVAGASHTVVRSKLVKLVPTLLSVDDSGVCSKASIRIHFFQTIAEYSNVYSTSAASRVGLQAIIRC